MSTPAVIRFGCRIAAEDLVAGLPAAARAVHQVALAGIEDCALAAGDEPLPIAVRREIFRLAGAMRLHGLNPQGGGNWTDPARWLATRLLLIDGEAQVDAAAIRAALASGASPRPGLRFIDAAGDSAPRADSPISTDPKQRSAQYAAAARRIIAATAKSTDGLVSRNLNRPISQAISLWLLRIPGIRPVHATFGTALLAAAMFGCLVLLGSPAGLVVGAVLFHAASVFDGVDGEIARATFHATHRGAMLDSLVDAATNLLFIAGIVVNLAQRGRWIPAMFGVAGLAMLALGLTTLGTRAKASGEPITFDGAKHRFRAAGSRWGQWAIWLTMRDFLALAAVVLVIVGLAEAAIIAFSAIMAVWLAVVMTTPGRQSGLAS